MLVPFSSLEKRHKKDKRKYVSEFKKSLKDSEFILGQSAKNFEDEFSNFVGSKFAIGVGNGSDAIRLALTIKNLPTGGNVILAANTYFAAAAAVIHAGLIPKFFDVSLENRFPRSEQINSAIDLETVAIIRSHLFGEADQCIVKGLIEIHDCSQAHGTMIGSEHVGSGHLSTFSLYPGKNLGAFGDAGIITTDSAEESELLKSFRNQGTRSDKYLHEVVGFNSRLDSIQARILCIKLKNLIEENKKRTKFAELYFNNLNQVNSAIKLFQKNDNSYPTYHLFQVYLPEVDINDIQTKLFEFGISTGRHYPIPLHLQPAFKHLGYAPGDFPNSEKLAKHSISLPLFPEMTESQVNYVCEKLLEIVSL